MPADPTDLMSRRAMIKRALSWAAVSGVVAMVTTACSRLAFFAANLPAIFGNYSRRHDVAYGTEPQQRLDVYLPKQPSAAPRPLIVFWYGGRWEFGDKSDYRFVGATLAEAGYVAVLPNYRHYPQVKIDGFMEDAAHAAGWAVAHAREFNADPEQLYFMGHSAGAHIAVLLALDTRWLVKSGVPIPHIAGVIGLSGPYDFLPLDDADLQDMFGPPERYAESQPINFARADSPPMLLVHGDLDTDVWLKNTVNLTAALRVRGVKVTLRRYAKLKHADTVAALSLPARSRAPVLAEIEAFIAPRPPEARLPPPPSAS